jgi:hypothetical protein
MSDKEGTIDCWLAYGPNGDPYLAVCTADPEDARGVLADAWGSDKDIPQTKEELIEEMRSAGWVVIATKIVEPSFPPTGRFHVLS